MVYKIKKEEETFIQEKGKVSSKTKKHGSTQIAAGLAADWVSEGCWCGWRYAREVVWGLACCIGSVGFLLDAVGCHEVS